MVAAAAAFLSAPYPTTLFSKHPGAMALQCSHPGRRKKVIQGGKRKNFERFNLQLLESKSTLGPTPSIKASKPISNISKAHQKLQDFQWFLAIWIASLGFSLLLISWEDLSMSHPMRVEKVLSTRTTSSSSSSSWGQATIRGMAFGRTDRIWFSDKLDLESPEFENLPSYNEVMQKHRNDRVRLWHQWDETTITANKITKQDVAKAVENIQKALLKLIECKQLAKDYQWDELGATLMQPELRRTLDSSCYLLQRADVFLSSEARQVIGFDWGSCAWRHCGALADAQEALDEVEHLLGILEPFECLFCLDIVERSLRDILAATSDFQNPQLQSKIPAYETIQRMSDVNQDDLDGFDMDFIRTLSEVKSTE
jgi:hypothetical protein